MLLIFTQFVLFVLNRAGSLFMIAGGSGRPAFDDCSCHCFTANLTRIMRTLPVRDPRGTPAVDYPLRFGGYWHTHPGVAWIPTEMVCPWPVPPVICDGSNTLFT